MGGVPEVVVRPVCLVLVLAACGRPDPAGRAPVGRTAVGAPVGLPTGAATTTTGIAGTGPADLELHGQVPCADPGARGAQWWDRTLFDAQYEDQSLLHGGGLAIADFDGDGRLDLFLPAGSAYQLQLQQADGGWVDRADLLGGVDLAEASAASAADYDGDGDFDLFVARDRRPDVLLRNDGGAFTDVTAAAGIRADLSARSMAAAWEDWDRDGDLDLAVSVYSRARPNDFYLNRGDGTFVHRADLLPPSMDDGLTFQMSFYDLDFDGDVELMVANDHWQNGADTALFTWDGQAFVEVPEAGYHPAWDGMGIAVADFNGDGLPDVAETTWKDIGMLTGLASPSSRVGQVFVDSSAVMGLDKSYIDDDQRFSWGIDAGDLDNDGDLDLAATWGHWESGSEFERPLQPDSLWVFEGGVFAEQPFVDYGAGRALLFVDVDRDGWLDLVKRQLKEPTIADFGRCGDGAWLEVEVRDVPGSLNRHGVGVRVEVEAGGRRHLRWIEAGSRSMYSGGPPEVHVGLGDAEVADLAVFWPDGRAAAWTGVPTRQRVTVHMIASE